MDRLAGPVDVIGCRFRRSGRAPASGAGPSARRVPAVQQAVLAVGDQVEPVVRYLEERATA